MTSQLVTFYQKGGLAYAFLGVHVIGLASDTGRWMFALDGDATWRRSVGDLGNAKAAIERAARHWYDAAHQPLKVEQAERLCEQARLLRPKREIRIKEIDLEAVALRIREQGTMTTFVMPPVAEGLEAPAVGTIEIRAWCVSAQEIAQARCRAAPGDRLAEHELGVFSGMIRLIDSVRSSTVIRDELKRIARERAIAEQPESPGEAENPADTANQGETAINGAIA